MQRLIIKGELTDLNTYIGAMNNNRYKGNALKKQDTELVYYSCKEQDMKVITKPVFIVFEWYSRNLRVDNDNLCFAKKSVLDGLVLAKVLKNDSRKEIIGFTDIFNIDPDNPRVEITFYPNPKEIKIKDYIA